MDQFHKFLSPGRIVAAVLFYVFVYVAFAAASFIFSIGYEDTILRAGDRPLPDLLIHRFIIWLDSRTYSNYHGGGFSLVLLVIFPVMAALWSFYYFLTGKIIKPWTSTVIRGEVTWNKDWYDPAAMLDHHISDFIQVNAIIIGNETSGINTYEKIKLCGKAVLKPPSLKHPSVMASIFEIESLPLDADIYVECIVSQEFPASNLLPQDKLVGERTRRPIRLTEEQPEASGVTLSVKLGFWK